MTTLLIYKVKYGQLSPRPHCSLLSLPQLEPELKSIPLTPIDIQDLELATGYEVSGHCRMEKEEELWGEWSPILSFQTLPSGRDLRADPSAFVLSPGSLSSHAPLICAALLILASSKRCMDIREPLRDTRWTEIPAFVEGELWRPLHFSAQVRKRPDNNEVNKTEVTVLPS